MWFLILLSVMSAVSQVDIHGVCIDRSLVRNCRDYSDWQWGGTVKIGRSVMARMYQLTFTVLALMDCW